MRGGGGGPGIRARGATLSGRRPRISLGWRTRESFTGDSPFRIAREPFIAIAILSVRPFLFWLSLSLSLSLLASSGIAADFSDVRRGRFGDLRICEGIIVLISGGLSGGYQLSRA